MPFIAPEGHPGIPGPGDLLDCESKELEGVAMESFLHQYGALAVFAGMWVEGETVLVIAGFLAHQKLLAYGSAYVAAVLGTSAFDSAVYTAGRLSGRVAVLGRFHRRAQAACARLGDFHHRPLIFLAVRFLYGLRTPFLFLVGGSRLGWGRFLVRDLPAVAVWAAVWLFFGHTIGHLLTLGLGHLHHHIRLAVVAVVAAAGLAATLVVLLRSRRRAARAAAGEEAPPSAP